jgi:hypothetical protein
MNLSQTLILSPDVISQEVSGETVLLDLRSECYFDLYSVGTRIWQLIRDSGELRAIYKTLLEKYEVEEAKLQTYLEAVLTDASEQGLITLREAP